MSQISKARTHQRLLKAKVSILTGYSADELFNMAVDTAFTYLREIWKTDEYGMEMLPKSPEFWAWWRMEWARIDKLYLDDMKHRPNRAHRYYRVYYEHYHKAGLNNIFINSAVMEASAHKLIKRLAKTK